MEAIWWKTQSIDPKTKEPIGTSTLYVNINNKDQEFGRIVISNDITSSIEDAKNSIIETLVKILEDGYKEVEQQLND